MAGDDDPVTGRRMLTQSSHADDRHLRSRMAIYRYAEVPADPGWRISPVAWDGTQVATHMLYHVPDVPAAVAELRRIVKQGGILLASTNSERGMAEVNDLFGAAVSDVLGRPVRGQPGNSFTTETGAAILATAFSDVTLHRHELPLAIPSAEPVVTYLDSIREPVLSYLGEPLDFDAVLGLVAARVEEVIRERGTFRAVNRSGVFVCR